jgi:hypothetical protein
MFKASCIAENLYFVKERLEVVRDDVILQAVPVRGIPRLRTFIGTTRLQVRRSILASGRNSLGCFSRRVGALDMVVVAGELMSKSDSKIVVLGREKESRS